jgi:hypothetical protein
MVIWLPYLKLGQFVIFFVDMQVLCELQDFCEF